MVLAYCTAPWAAWCNTWLFIKLTPKDIPVVFSFLNALHAVLSINSVHTTGACKPARMMHPLEIKSAGQRHVACRCAKLLVSADILVKQQFTATCAVVDDIISGIY